MLQIRPNCENCNRDLVPDDIAYICTFECTWCPSCTASFDGGLCPNCHGNLERRPIRPARALAKFPASTERVLRGQHAG